MRRIITIFPVFVFLLVFTLSSDLYASQSYSLRSPDFRTELTENGFDALLIDGYYSYGVPGYPELPSKILRLAIPPDILDESIQVEYTIHHSEELGSFEIDESPAMVARYGEDKIISPKADVYSNDAYYPERNIEYLGISQMRKWKFIKIKYNPFQYNPVTKQLRFVSEVDVNITYSQIGRNSVSATVLTDDVMSDRAKQLFTNFSESEKWYQPDALAPSASAPFNYVIVTTNAIESASTMLSDFVTYLGSKGFAPLVITEDEYGGLTGQAPNGTAEKIRQWLINNYIGYGIEYVLLIGNPDPDDPSNPSDSVGDVPMKMCWPRRYEASYQESPTDYFYADLTGNWDLDGDQYFGEYCDAGLVCGSGHGDVDGVDFANEVYVGRIPVYSGGVANLDSVLAKTINYGNESDIAWRQNALLPMSYSDASTDGAHLSEAMISDYLNGSGFSNWTLYMQGNVCTAADSTFDSDQELVTDASWQRWRDNDYGMVWWWGHGSQTGAAIGYSGCGWGDIINSSDTSVLDDTHPSHVYQCSCLNGYPEVGSANPTTSNLGTALLYNGAITTTSASRVSWYAVTSWSTGLKYYSDNASIGYYYGQELVVNEKKASVALFDVKSDMGANHNGAWDGCHWMNLFDFNLYGDPAMSLTEQGSTYGDELSADFGANGLWHNDGSWLKISNWNPDDGHSGWSGGLGMDFGANGVWNNDGSSWSRITVWNAGSAGLTGWSDGLASDFDADGLWSYDGSSWSKMSNWDPDSDLSGWNGGLAVDFGTNGLWNNDGAAWSRMTTWNTGSAGLASWSAGLAADFDANGLWNFNGSAWQRLTTWDPENDLTGWPNGLAADFGTNGLWGYDGSSWRRLTTWNAGVMTGVSDGLVVDFGVNGTWKYDGTSWSKLTNWSAENMSDVDLN